MNGYPPHATHHPTGRHPLDRPGRLFGARADNAILDSSRARGGLILVADDEEGNRELLSRRLRREGYEVVCCENGRIALDAAQRTPVDLILLDVMMPEMDGVTALEHLKSNGITRDVPIVMISAVDDIESVAKCIQLGADDYLPKPFNPVILRARVGALYERKKLRDQELRQRDEILREREAADNLLRNILPAQVASELRERGSVTPMYFEDVTIVFTDFVGFTLSTEQLPADELVRALDAYFRAFDSVADRYKIEKLKTIGDSYMFAAGLPARSSSHPVDATLAALEIVDITKSMAEKTPGPGWCVRVGAHTGPVIAGVVGKNKFAFDVWGDAVNLASRMESSGAPNRLNVSATTFARIKDFFRCERRGPIETKDRRSIDMYFVDGLSSSFSGFDDERFRQRYRAYFGKDVPASGDHSGGEAGDRL